MGRNLGVIALHFDLDGAYGHSAMLRASPGKEPPERPGSELRSLDERWVGMTAWVLDGRTLAHGGAEILKCVFAVACLMLISTADAFPQSSSAAAEIHGRIVDQKSGRAIEGVSVVLRGSSDDSLRLNSVTNASGRFMFSELIGGEYSLELKGLGYLERTAIIRVSAGRILDVELALSNRPIELPALVVTARSNKLIDAGFYERRESGLPGQFLTRADIEHYQPRGFTDLFERIKSTHVVYAGPGQRIIRFRRWPTMSRGVNPDGCVPDVYIDGTLVGAISSLDNIYMARLDDYDILPPLEIEGVEVYVGATTPLQYRNSCGVILVWTRR